MKGQKSAILYFLAIVSLIGIGVVLGASLFRGNSIGKTNSDILGAEETSQNPTPFVDLNGLIQTTYQSSKDAAQQKINDMQKIVVSNIEKEINMLTQSQVAALKQQVCIDWGVITVTPTKTP